MKMWSFLLLLVLLFPIELVVLLSKRVFDYQVP